MEALRDDGGYLVTSFSNSLNQTFREEFINEKNKQKNTYRILSIAAHMREVTASASPQKRRARGKPFPSKEATE